MAGPGVSHARPPSRTIAGELSAAAAQYPDGIAICYDIEFPLIAHAMARAGAELILAPSCTDTIAGANRVHVGARARALENQVYVAVAPTVGQAPWSPARPSASEPSSVSSVTFAQHSAAARATTHASSGT